MADAVSFNILVDISSGPDALLVSKVCNSSVISSSEQRSLGGHWSESTCNLLVSEMSRGGTERFKQLEKNWFNIVAFSLSDEATEPSSVRVGIDGDEVLSFFTALQNFLAFEDRLLNFSMWDFLALRKSDTSLLRVTLYFNQEAEVFNCLALLKRTFRLLIPFISLLFSQGALLPAVKVEHGIHAP